jgi:uncharacterized protein
MEIKKLDAGESKGIIARAREFVESECRKPTSHYGTEIFVCHFIPVREYALELAKTFSDSEADKEVLELAAWLHDIGSIIYGREDHHTTGARVAEEKLKEWNYPPEKIEKVKKCIFSHRGSQNVERLSIEEQIIADADALSAFDNISGLFKAAIFHEGFDQMKAKAEVRRKLQNSWQKLSPAARKMIEHKYLAAMILLAGETYDQ